MLTLDYYPTSLKYAIHIVMLNSWPSILLNVFKGEHELHCARGALNLLFCYVNFLTQYPANSIPGLVSIDYPELLLIIPHRYTELQEMLDKPKPAAEN